MSALFKIDSFIVSQFVNEVFHSAVQNSPVANNIFRNVMHRCSGRYFVYRTNDGNLESRDWHRLGETVSIERVLRIGDTKRIWEIIAVLLRRRVRQLLRTLCKTIVSEVGSEEIVVGFLTVRWVGVNYCELSKQIELNIYYSWGTA